MQLQENLNIQLNQEVQEQLREGTDHNTMRARVGVTLGKSVQLPCQWRKEKAGKGQFQVEWKDNHGRVLDLSRRTEVCVD